LVELFQKEVADTEAVRNVPVFFTHFCSGIVTIDGVLVLTEKKPAEMEDRSCMGSIEDDTL